jgi:alcohol dehydrogenase class IV
VAEQGAPSDEPLLSERERDFAWRDGERLIRFAAGAIDEAPALLAEGRFEDFALLSTARALDSSDGSAPLAEGAAAVLEVPPGPVPDAAAAVRERVRGRPLVALGGGRVVDAAKAIAAVDGLRCAAIPTTLSGAELTAIHRLPAGAPPPAGGLVRPAVVVADPKLMASAPEPQLAASAMNALAHGAEALYGPGASPVTELAALRGAELIASGLEPPGADRSGLELDREALALGAVLCAWAIDGAGLGLHHALCQTVVRTLGTPHAQANAIVLAHVLRFVAPHAPRELGLLAAALGAQEPDPALASTRAAALSAPAGARSLSELGVEETSLDRVVDEVLRRPEPTTTPGRPGRRELEAILRAAL